MGSTRTSGRGAGRRGGGEAAMPPLDDLLCHAIYVAGHAFTKVYKPLLAKLGLTYPQYLVMVALWEQDAQTVGSLGRRLALESSTLTPLLKRLETAKLLKRQRDPDDERQVVITLTERGRALRADAVEVPACIAAACEMSSSELGDLVARLKRLTETLERNAAP
jgi:DNA-binding MarR family transcriptional regulator